MQAKFEGHYSSIEKEEILSSLVSCGLLTEKEVASEAASFSEIQINFHSVNDLFIPFLQKFAWHAQWERKVFPWHQFYTEFAVKLMQNSPLIICELNCYFDEEADKIIVQIGSVTKSLSFETYPEYLANLTKLTNKLMHDCLPGWAFHEIHVVDLTTFLLLTEKQYHFLLENRLVRFAQVEYPEETAWRSTLKEEDFLF